jgi:hypothetical protein
VGLLHGATSCLLGVGAAILVASPGLALAGDVQPPGGIASTTIPPAQIFSCGATSTFTKVGITDHGNVLQLESPAGNEHILVGTARSGYQVCYDTGGGFAAAWDFGSNEGGWPAGAIVFQPNGPSTFPLEIRRTSADGKVSLKRRFTGNSFVATGPLFDLNGDGVSCSTLSECGNCGNRTIHVLTTITNNTGLTMSVRFVELVDVDISGTSTNDRFAKTADAAIGWEDLADTGADTESRGVLLQTLILPAAPEVFLFGGYSVNGLATGAPPPNCLPGSTATGPAVTPTGPTDGELYLRQDMSLGPGSNSGSNVRIHYRRF